ncbi:uncharacterized protein LOC131880590 [Tigriopus californicus]|uniref:uncharacterized protein LOC131880590 n=1 Tax=Tigriopus californicus TaxID=6832 RepID=UPI0027DA3F2A|nr:uncharacterized protein LOC131880590 [Tigriopus californicus]
MYVDASECCNDLVFLLGGEGIGTNIRQRQWSIKITQYSCDYENLAPGGCTQYFFDTDGVDTVQTYNFDGGLHLASQNQNICVRRERGNCKICWTASNDEDFDLSGTSSPLAFVTTSACCGHGSNGVSSFGYDCVSIPGAKTALGPSTKIGPSRICGRNKGLGTTFSGPQVTICTQQTPFNIRFLSDKYEVFGDISESGQMNKGFRLTYIQSSNGC